MLSLDECYNWMDKRFDLGQKAVMLLKTLVKLWISASFKSLDEQNDFEKTSKDVN